MTFQETPYIWPLLGGAFIALIAGLNILFFYRERSGSQLTVFILLAAAEWLITYWLELSTVTLATKVFWNQAQYIGITISLSGILIFSLQGVGLNRWLTRRNLILFNVIPAGAMVMALTNSWHGWFWPFHELMEEAGLVMLTHPHGVGYWVYITYAMLEVTAVILILTTITLDNNHLYRRQAFVLMSGLLAIWLINLIDALGLNPMWPLNVMPILFGVAIGPITWAIFKLQVGDVVPVARTAVVEEMLDGVVVLDDLLRVVDINPAARRILSVTTAVLGLPFPQLVPENTTSLNPRLPSCSQELTIETNGRRQVFDMQFSPLRDWREHEIGQVVVLHDITLRKQVEQATEKSLQEKELLLKEIHHRVKNNLQVISSLLNLQAQRISDPIMANRFDESQHRIRSMAFIHEKLYQSGDLATIDFGDYVRDLTAYLFSAYRTRSDEVSLTIEVDDLFLDVDTAVSCGLMLNELVSNALKHAFPDGRVGEIILRLQKQPPGYITLCVCDDGVGFPEGLNINQANSLGLRLLNTLVSQLDAELENESEKGTRFQIRFVYPN